MPRYEVEFDLHWKANNRFSLYFEGRNEAEALAKARKEDLTTERPDESDWEIERINILSVKEEQR